MTCKTCNDSHRVYTPASVETPLPFGEYVEGQPVIKEFLVPNAIIPCPNCALLNLRPAPPPR